MKANNSKKNPMSCANNTHPEQQIKSEQTFTPTGFKPMLMNNQVQTSNILWNQNFQSTAMLMHNSYHNHT